MIHLKLGLHLTTATPSNLNCNESSSMEWSICQTCWPSTFRLQIFCIMKYWISLCQSYKKVFRSTICCLEVQYFKWKRSPFGLTNLRCTSEYQILGNERFFDSGFCFWLLVE